MPSRDTRAAEGPTFAYARLPSLGRGEISRPATECACVSDRIGGGGPLCATPSTTARYTETRRESSRHRTSNRPELVVRLTHDLLVPAGDGARWPALSRARYLSSSPCSVSTEPSSTISFSPLQGWKPRQAARMTADRDADSGLLLPVLVSWLRGAWGQVGSVQLNWKGGTDDCTTPQR